MTLPTRRSAEASQRTQNSCFALYRVRLQKTLSPLLDEVSLAIIDDSGIPQARSLHNH